MKYFKIALIFLVLPLLAFAAPQAGFLDSLKCVASNDNCQLADVAEGFQALIRLLLGGMGAVALLYFVIGGFQWVTSRGNSERVRDGQRTMVNTLIALAIAFTSYLVLSFFINNILGVKNDYQVGSGLGQCEYKSDGTACNVVAGSDAINPYACFAQRCVTKCEVKARTSNQNWQCFNIVNPDLLPDNPAYYERNICNGDEHMICTLLNASGQPADPTYQAYLNSLR